MTYTMEICFLTIPEARSQYQGAIGLASDEASFPDLLSGAISLCSHVALLLCARGEKGREISGVSSSSYKNTSSITLETHPYDLNSPKSPVCKHSHTGN